MDNALREVEILENQVALVFIRDTRGCFFVVQRRMDKKVYPGLFALGAGGKVENNESPACAAMRELKEETELTASIYALGDFPYADSEVQHHVYVYEAWIDQPINNCENEWAWSGWMTLDQIRELRDSGQLCPDTAVAVGLFKAI